MCVRFWNPAPATKSQSKKTNNVPNGCHKIRFFHAVTSCNMVSHRIITAQAVTMRFVGKCVCSKGRILSPAHGSQES